MKPYFDAIPAFAALPHPFFFQSSMAAAPDLNPGSTGIALVRGTLAHERDDEAIVRPVTRQGR